ncbi:MAG: serine/threonine-protein kinase [Planctomycetota bacterium]
MPLSSLDFDSNSDDPESAEETCDPVEVLASDFIGRLRLGEQPTIEDYAQRHPELASRISQLFPLILTVEGIKAADIQSTRGAVTTSGHDIKQLGEFRILREIGRGAMGVVYEAEQESLGRIVAIKILPQAAVLDESNLVRFESEAKTVAGLHHSNIVQVFGTGQFDGIKYLVMQRIEGLALDDALRADSGQFTTQRIAEIGQQISDAMQYAHRKQILHRDIKPANIILDEAGKAWITDFGLASYYELDRRNLDSQKCPNNLRGSLRYMAPEQFDQAADVRSEVYSLGLTLFELACGRPGFVGEDAPSMIANIRRGERPSLSSLPNAISADLIAVIEKACSHQPENRYEDASELREDLSLVLKNLPVRARTYSAKEKVLGWLSRNPRIATASAAAILCLVLATIASTVGYWFTSQANVAAKDALEREAKQLARAESTITTALDSFDQILDAASLSYTGWTNTPENSVTWISSGTSVTSERTHVLERMLPLYEQLAAQSPDRIDVLEQSVAATLRVAQIQHQLGQLTAATETLQQGIEKANAATEIGDDKHFYLARMWNELGYVQRHQLLFSAADTSHLRALESASAASSIRQTMERAKASLALGNPHPLRDVTPNKAGDNIPVPNEANDSARRYLQQAKTELTSIPNLELQSDAKYLLACCYRAEANSFPWNSAERQEAANAATELFTELLESEPSNPDHLFGLSQVLADVPVRELRQAEDLQMAEQNLRQALLHSQRLTKLHPNVSAFASEQVHIYHKLSAVLRNSGQPESAITLVRRAIEVQSELAKLFPKDFARQVWKALLRRSLAALLKEMGRDEEARDQIQQGILDLKTVDSIQDQHPFVQKANAALANLLEQFDSNEGQPEPTQN